MTAPALLCRTPSAALLAVRYPAVALRGLRVAAQTVGARVRADDGVGQFARFVLVGGISSALYALCFWALDGVGDQPANVVGAIASSALANELHRRLTFRAGSRIGWFAAQCEGGLLALVGMVITGLSLAWLDAVVGDASVTLEVAMVAAVTGLVGLVRFVALRWVFRPQVAHTA